MQDRAGHEVGGFVGHADAGFVVAGAEPEVFEFGNAFQDGAVARGVGAEAGPVAEDIGIAEGGEEVGGGGCEEFAGGGGG